MLSKFLLAALLVVSALASDDKSKFAPYGPLNGDTVLPANDDSVFGPFPFEFTFYGSSRSSLYISNNGIITFDGPVSTFTPSALCSVPFAAATPFWGDVFTAISNGGTVSYRADSDAALLALWSSRTPDPNFHGVRSFIITWDNVAYYAANNKHNSFQAILITDGPNSYVFYNYGTLEWTTGSASGGTNGLGGTPAAIGFASGTGTCVQTSESLTAGVLDTTNFVTRVSGANVVIPPTSRCGDGNVDANEQCDGGACCNADCTFDNSVTCFCGRQTLADGEMGYYCNANGGFYQCLGGVFAAQSRDMACASGTQCACAFGTECSCHLSQSPCNWPGVAQQC